MPNLDVIRNVTLRYTTQGAAEYAAAGDRATSAHGRLASSADVVAVATDRQSKATLSVTRQLEAYARANDPAFKAAQNLERAQLLVNRALAQGQAGTAAYTSAMAAVVRQQRELAGANDNAAKSTDTAAKAHDAHAHGMGNAAASGQELVHVLKAVADETAAGVPITRALQVESGRLFQIFTSGGFSGAIGTVASKFAILANPLVAITAGTLGLGAAALYAASSYRSMNEELERSLRGAGGFSGLSAEGLNSVAKQAAPGAGLSLGQSRDAAMSFAAGGHMDAENIGRATQLVRGYAGAFGVGYGEAGQALAGIFADPTRGAEKLNEKLGFLNEATRTYIHTLQAQGDLQGAVRAAIDASTVSLNSQAEKVTGLAKIMRDASVDAEHFRDAVGKFVFGSSDPIERVRDAEDRIAHPDMTMLMEQARRSADEFRRSPEAARGRAYAGMSVTAAGAAYDPTTDPFNLVEDMRHRAELRDRQQRDIEAGRQSIAAGDTLRSTLPDYAERERMQNERDSLSRTLANPDAVHALGQEAGAAFEALGRLNVGLATFATTADKMRQDSAFRVAAINAEDAAGKLAVDVQAAYAKTLRDTHDAAQASAAAETTRAEAIANATKRISDATDALEKQTSLIGLKPYQRLAVEAQNRVDDFKNDNVLPGFKTMAGVPVGTAAMDAAPVDIQAMIRDAATRTGQDPNVIAAIGQKENSYRLTGGTTMLGSDGRPSSAYGFGQLTDGAARDVAAAVPGFDKRDPSTAVFGAAEYLKILRDRNGGDLGLALNAYGGTPTYAADIARRSGTAFAQAGSAKVITTAGTDLSDYTKASNDNLAKSQAQLSAEPFTRAREEVDALTASVQAQKDAYGKTGHELDAYNERTKILASLQSAGVPVTDAMRSNAAKLGDEYASAKKSLDDFMDRQKQLIGAMDDVRSAGKGFLDPLVQAGLHGTSAMAALHQGLESVASKISGKLEDTAIDSLFGKSGTPGGGLFGGALGSLFGSGGASAASGSFLYGFSSGGYTGAGSKYQPAGIVHAGEYVMDAASVSRIGVGALDAMRRGIKGYADGGFVTPASMIGGSMPQPANDVGGDTHYHIDARGSTLTHAEMTSALTSAIAANNRALPGMLADRQKRTS